MNNVGASKTFSITMAQTLQQATQILARDVQQNVDRLDAKKNQVADQGLQRLNTRNEIASQQLEARAKIDTFA